MLSRKRQRRCPPTAQQHDSASAASLDCTGTLRPSSHKDVDCRREGTPEDWANESHKLAVDVAYKDVPADGPPPTLDQKYIDSAGDCIDEQFEKGGVRLAMILNQTIGK